MQTHGRISAHFKSKALKVPCGRRNVIVGHTLSVYRPSRAQRGRYLYETQRRECMHLCQFQSARSILERCNPKGRQTCLSRYSERRLQLVAVSRRLGLRSACPADSSDTRGVCHRDKADDHEQDVDDSLPGTRGDGAVVHQRLGIMVSCLLVKGGEALTKLTG